MFLRLQPSVIPAFIRAVFRIAVEVLDRFCRNGLLGNKIEAIFVSFFSSMHEKSSMHENIESVKKYNLWFGNTIDCGFPRPLYTESVASYLGSKVVKVLTGQRRVGKSYILRQTAMHLVQ